MRELTELTEPTELTELSERSAGLLLRLDELGQIADELNLMPRLELWDRLTWALGFCEHDLLPAVDPGGMPPGKLRDITAINRAELATLVRRLREGRKAFLVGDTTGKLRLRRALYGLCATASVALRIQLEVVLPNLSADTDSAEDVTEFELRAAGGAG